MKEFLLFATGLTNTFGWIKSLKFLSSSKSVLPVLCPFSSFLIRLYLFLFWSSSWYFFFIFFIHSVFSISIIPILYAGFIERHRMIKFCSSWEILEVKEDAYICFSRQFFRSVSVLQSWQGVLPSTNS